MELFAQAREILYGIMRTFFVAYSSETALLQMADASGNVVKIRALSPDSDGISRLSEDRLILKRAISEADEPAGPYRLLTPSIVVHAIWREKMKLKNGDKIVVARAAGQYSLPPPTVV